MRLLIFGPTGGTGIELCKQAVERGHTVTAYARSPAKLSEIKTVTAFQGDIFDEEKVSDVVRTSKPEAVLIALGGSGIWARNYVCSKGTDNILSAIKTMDPAPRIVVCTSIGVGDSAPFIANFVRWMLKNSLADKEPQEEAIRNSGCPFVIIRPMMLQNSPGRGSKEITAIVAKPLPTKSISRADVATFMLDNLENDEFIGKAVGLAWTNP